MQQRRVGSTGLSVSRLGLGTWGWGTRVDEHEARDQLSAFVAAGGTLVDTAAGYGNGISEGVLGGLLGSVISRDEVVISTKAGLSEADGGWPKDTSRGTLLRQLDASLRRLGVDSVDLWQVHDWSDATPIEETLDAVDYAVRSGRVMYAGISNYCGWQTAQAATWQRAQPHRAPLAVTQIEYSLVNRAVEQEVLPAALAMGLGVFAWGPLGGGVLSGKYRTGIPIDSRAAYEPMADSVVPYLDDPSSRIVGAVARAAEGLGWTPAQVALTWVRDRVGMTAPIVGPRTTEQLRSLLASEDRSLPGELTAALDDVSER